MSVNGIKESNTNSRLLKEYEININHYRETLFDLQRGIIEKSQELSLILEKYEYTISELNVFLKDKVLDSLDTGKVSKESIKKSQPLGAIPYLVRRMKDDIKKIDLIESAVIDNNSKIKNALRTYTELAELFQEETK